MKRFLRDDSGVIAVTVAIMIVALLALAAVVIDVGYLYAEKRQLQAAADAAALAGCWELAHDNPQSTVLATAEKYANENAKPPGDGLTMLKSGPGTVVGSDYVKVTVEKASPLFFARIFGMATTPVRAQSVAKVEYLTGIENPIPWALPILRVTRGEVWIPNGPTGTLSDDDDDGTWTGQLTAADGDVYVTLYNDQTLDPNYPNGVPEQVGPVTRMFVRPATARIQEVRVEDMFFTDGLGESTDLWVTLSGPLQAGEKLRGGFGNKPPELTKVTDTLYHGILVAPSTAELWQSFPYQVVLEGQGADPGEKLDPAGYVVVRRSTFPVKDIYVEPTFFAEGAGGAADVSVELNQYKKGVQYELKVINQGGSVGNFMALDFSEIHHTPFWRIQDPVEYPELAGGGAGYYDYVAAAPDVLHFVMHIGDTVWTKTGNMSGPQTRSALEARFAGDTMTYDYWIANKEPYTPRLVYIPITEKVQEEGGRTALRVVMFATFFVEGATTDSGGALIRGRFVDYTSAPGQVGTPPPGQFGVKVPRLVNEHLDF